MPRAGSCSCSRHERTARPGRYGAAKPGETFVVSAASGVTGALAKQHGCRVVGITGSPEKGAWLRELGFDAAVDRTTGDLGEALREVCPDGIDVYSTTSAERCWTPRWGTWRCSAGSPRAGC